MDDMVQPVSAWWKSKRPSAAIPSDAVADASPNVNLGAGIATKIKTFGSGFCNQLARMEALPP
jgi:hypothetical protein